MQPVPRRPVATARAAPTAASRRPRAGSRSSSSRSWPGSGSSARSRRSAPTPRSRPTCRPAEPLTQYVSCPRRRSSTTGPGKIELARFGDAKREVVTFDEIPPILLDATTAIEDKTFWENAGFDPVAIVSAGLELAARRQPRRLDDHPAARPAAAARPDDLVQDPDRTAERKLKEIIQSIRVTQAFPGEEGKQEIITAYLNQNYYGNQSYGVKAAAESLLRDRPVRDRRRPRRRSSPALPKSPSNYDLVRNAIERCTDDGRRGRRLPGQGEPSWSCPTTPRSWRAATRSSTSSPAGRTPMSGDQYSRGRLPRGQARAGRPRQPDHAALDRAALRVGRPRRADREAVRRGRDDLRRSSSAGGLRVTTTLDVNAPEDRREVGPGGGDRAPRKDPAAAAKALGFDELDRAGWPTSASKALRNGALVALDYQTGELVAYVGSAELLLDLEPAGVPAAVRRGRQGLPPAGLGVQAVQLRRSASTITTLTAGDDADGRRRPTSAAATRRATPTTSSAARSASGTRSSSRSTSRRSRRWPSTRPTTSSPRPRSSG